MNFIEAMAAQDVIGTEDAADLIVAQINREWEEHMRPKGPSTREINAIIESDAKRREDETLARVRRAGREEALWDVVSLLNRAVSECRGRGQETASLEQVRAEVRKMAGG